MTLTSIFKQNPTITTGRRKQFQRSKWWHRWYVQVVKLIFVLTPNREYMSAVNPSCTIPRQKVASVLKTRQRFFSEQSCRRIWILPQRGTIKKTRSKLLSLIKKSRTYITTRLRWNLCKRPSVKTILESRCKTTSAQSATLKLPKWELRFNSLISLMIRVC